ncbi:hypothetical protein VR41_12380 [Streptomyces sp. NRRL B-1568]|nr:hypothetical protein VR41_12380 [Streptomyces sp. NRRL B-1568]
MRVNRLTVSALALLSATAALISSAPASAEPAHPQTKLTFFVLQNKATGRCIDDSNVGLRAFACNNTSFQEWQAVPIEGTGLAIFWKNMNTGRCIDDSNLGLRSFDCNGLDFQKWWIGQSSGGTGAHPLEWFQNQATTGCLDDSFDFGLRSVGCNGTDWQTFRVEE